MSNPLALVDPTGYSWLSSAFDNFSRTFERLLLIGAAPSAVMHHEVRLENDKRLRANPWVQPIVLIAACYFGGPYGCAGADAYLTKLNGGSTRQAVAAGSVTFASSEAYSYIDAQQWNQGQTALAKGAVGGAASSLTGGSFRSGFYVAAGTSLASSIYAKTTGHDADWGPGESRPNSRDVCDVPGSSCYRLDEDHQVPESFGPGNTWGTNEQLKGGFWKDLIKQSGPLSLVMDLGPGQQALSQLHDVLPINWLTNVPLMFPAIVVTYGALLDDFSTVPSLNLQRH
jgi:hypothetical protein